MQVTYTENEVVEEDEEVTEAANEETGSDAEGLAADPEKEGKEGTKDEGTSGALFYLFFRLLHSFIYFFACSSVCFGRLHLSPALCFC